MTEAPPLSRRYDPKTDTWTAVAPMSVSRDAVGVCLLGDRLYAVGGYDGQVYLNTVEAYDPQTNEWTQVFLKKSIYQFYLCFCFLGLETHLFLSEDLLKLKCSAFRP